MKPEYIKRFEKLGFGMFVHFGLYSMIGKGEWYYFYADENAKKDYFTNEFADKFNPKKDWATKLVKTAKKAGAKYITLTTKHHEGYFMYDSCGLTDWDSIHHGPKRDLVKEFVDACNKEGIIPFFYHALLDWHNEDYKKDFASYIDFLIKSVELLCKNYGKIGGFWFDGFWDNPSADWQFDRLYKTIRGLQPEAMIINNTGMDDEGRVGHYEIDSVTFERGHPKQVSSKDGKERAGEMCEIFGEHWGYGSCDIAYKPVSQIISTLINCRYCNCNLLLNVGPKGDGTIKELDKSYLDSLSMWIKRNKNFIYNVKKSDDLEATNALILKDDKYYYAVVENVHSAFYPDVQKGLCNIEVTIPNHKIKNAVYLDNNKKVILNRGKHSFKVEPFDCGDALYARVIRFK